MVSRAYLDGVREAFARLGDEESERFRATTQAPPVPVRELHASTFRLAHQRGDELGGLVGLRVPLDAEDVAAVRQLDGSGSSSSVAQPGTSRPSPTRSTPWW